MSFQGTPVISSAHTGFWEFHLPFPDIIFESVEARRIGLQKTTIVKVFGNHDISHGDQQGGIRARFNLNPLLREATAGGLNWGRRR